MRAPAALCAALLALAACAADDPPAARPAAPPEASAPPPEAAAGLPPLTPDGWGPLRVGMTREEVVAALGEDRNPHAVGGPNPEECDEFRPERAPEGMIVMIENGRLSRITLVSGSEVRTSEGFGPGDEAARIEAAYGTAAEVTPHKYISAPARYVTVWSAGSGSAEPRGVVYETGVDGRVSHVHAGGPSIGYVEGCL